MPRGVADSPETRSFVMGLHAQERSLSDLSRGFEIPRDVSPPRRAVEAFVGFYNHERPHLSLNGMTPVQRTSICAHSSHVTTVLRLWRRSRFVLWTVAVDRGP